MPFIQIKTGPNKGRTFEVKDNVITIGRDENQTIQILDQGVSRTHAEIFRMGEMCFVRDLNSTNGTFINSMKATEEVLKPGDELLIGTTILIFDDKTPSPLEAGSPSTSTATNLTTVGPTERKQKSTGDSGSRGGGASRSLGVVLEIDRILADAGAIEEGLHSALQRLADTLEADHAYFYGVNPDSRAPELRTAVEPGGGQSNRKSSKTIVNRVLSSGAGLLTSDAALDNRFSLSESVVLKKIKSVIALPIVIHGRTEGLLYLHSARPERTYTQEDLEIASIVSLHLGKAIAQGQPRRNKELVRKFYEEAWNGGNWKRAADFMAADAAIVSSMAGAVRGLDEFKTAMNAVTASFPDLQTTVDEVTAEENRVVARLTYKGTHKGKIFGIEPTSRVVSFPGLATFEISSGKIVKAWLLSDTSQLLKQLDPHLGMSVDRR